MRKCSNCKVVKNFDQFYKEKQRKDGYGYFCKQCYKEREKKRQLDPYWIDKRKLQNAKYHEENRDQIAERKKKWRSTENAKILCREQTKRWKKKNSSKVLAHHAVENALKTGKIVKKERCEICNSKVKLDAHHPDYRKHLSVIWLCRKCHSKLT